MKTKYLYRIINLLPNFLYPFEKYIIRKSLNKVGNNFRIAGRPFIGEGNKIVIGNDVFIGIDFFCAVNNSLIIKDRVMFGSKCTILGGDHKYDDPNYCMRFNENLGDNRPIVIEEDAWIGHGTTILKKAYISEGSIIGANSLVNEIIKPYSVYAGNPLKFIKPRFSNINVLHSYLKMMRTNYSFYTNYGDQELEALYKC